MKKEVFYNHSWEIVFVIFTALLFVVFSAWSANIPPVGQEDHKWSWGENIGWQNWGTSTYEGVGVTVANEGLTGYVWAENVGWIKLDYDGVAGATNTSSIDWGVTNSGGNLAGYAWGENIGWINFDTADSQVTIDSSGHFSGYAWGENIGWIKFDHTQTDYIIWTTWTSGPSEPPVYTLATTTGKTIRVHNDLTIGDGTREVTVTASSTNPNLIVDGNITITATSTLIAPPTSAFKVGGNWANSGTFTHNSGKVTFDTTATSTISGATTFYNFTSTSSNKTLAFEKQTEGSPAFTFINDFIVTGTDGNLVNIRSNTPGTQWFPYFEKDQGTYATPTVAYAHIQDSGGATTSKAVYLDTTSEKGTNVDTNYWKWDVVAEIAVSGIIYTDEAGTSPYDCSANSLIIGVSINGISTATTSCTLATGAYSRNVDPPASAGDPVVVFIDSAKTPKATTATLAADTSSNIADLHLFIDRVSITHESAGPMTNAKLADGDNSDAGIRYSTSNGNLTIESGLKLLMRADKTFTPGGTVTTPTSASSTLPGGDMGIQTGAELNMGTNALSVGGNYLNSGTFSWSPEQTTTFTATAAGHTVTDGGYAFNVIVFNGSGGGWLYQDSTSTAPATTTVLNGNPTFLNAKTGTVDVQSGTLNVDWYLGIHVVAVFSTSTNIENATATISEETASSTVWKMSESSWGSASTSQWTVTDAGGKNPQPTSNGAIRIREYSNVAGTAAYYKYNLTIVVSSGYSPYDYYLDHGNKYIASASSTDIDVDAVISQNWHRETVSQMNTPYSSVNEPPTNGSWYAGMSSDLEFSVDSATVNFVSLTDINKLTATATTMLYATTSFPGGYTITSFAANDGKLATSTYSIPRLDAGNASPVEWLGACWDSDHCGFGYNTDNLVRFYGNKYAGFATSTPGDPVAYESTDVPSGASYTITYKVSAPPTTTPETYKTVITYLAKVNY